jgi:hypothetical protein
MRPLLVVYTSGTYQCLGTRLLCCLSLLVVLVVTCFCCLHSGSGWVGLARLGRPTRADLTQQHLALLAVGRLCKKQLVGLCQV